MYLELEKRISAIICKPSKIASCWLSFQTNETKKERKKKNVSKWEKSEQRAGRVKEIHIGEEATRKKNFYHQQIDILSM